MWEREREVIKPFFTHSFTTHAYCISDNFEGFSCMCKCRQTTFSSISGWLCCVHTESKPLWVKCSFSDRITTGTESEFLTVWDQSYRQSGKVFPAIILHTSFNHYLMPCMLIHCFPHLYIIFHQPDFKYCPLCPQKSGCKVLTFT